MNDTTSIVGKAMLAHVTIRMWEARKHDKKVTEEVNSRHQAASDAGRYHKHLFGGKIRVHLEVMNAAIGARNLHYTETLPWLDNGPRLLPTANYYAYTEAMRRAKTRFESAVEKFLAAYQTLKDDAKTRLQDMYLESDYPGVDQLRRRFSFEISFSPIPTGDDFRIDLPQEEIQRMAKDVEAKIGGAAELAMREAWGRLGEVVEALDDRLDESETRRLRDSMIQRIVAVAESLGRMNITGDPKLDAMRKRVITQLGSLDAKTLKTNEKAREETAKKTRDILAAMQGFYGPRNGEKGEATP